MPCQSEYPSDNREDRRLREELERVTRVACELASFARKFKQGFSKETEAWMADHARLDRARRLREEAQREEAQIKNSALRKLTPKERRLLGI